jgi:hypothetical protein
MFMEYVGQYILRGVLFVAIIVCSICTARFCVPVETSQSFIERDLGVDRFIEESPDNSRLHTRSTKY